MGEQARGRDWAEIPIVETVPIMDTFATGWVVETTEDYVRVVCYADHPLAFPLGDMSPIERQVVAKLVYPRRLFDSAMVAMLEAVPILRLPFVGH